MSRWVLEQNYFRDADLKARLADQNNHDEFVMTDYAFIEMFKSCHWEMTSRRSLAPLVGYPERISVSFPACDLLQSELGTRKATCGWNSMVDSDITERLRAYLRVLATVGQKGPIHACRRFFFYPICADQTHKTAAESPRQSQTLAKTGKGVGAASHTGGTVGVALRANV